jgi:hypothetical protein
MGLFGSLLKFVPRFLGPIFKGGLKPFATMAASKAAAAAKEAAINLAKQKAAEAAANLAKTAAEKTGITGLVGQGAVDAVAGGAGDLATKGVDSGVSRVFQK